MKIIDLCDYPLEAAFSVNQQMSVKVLNVLGDAQGSATDGQGAGDLGNAPLLTPSPYY